LGLHCVASIHVKIWGRLRTMGVRDKRAEENILA